MNKIKSVLFMAGISLALVFTFGCSSGDDDGEGDSFDVNSQVYNRDGSPFTGDGVINIEVQVIGDVDMPPPPSYTSDVDPGSEPYNRPLINVGSVTNGIVQLKLPDVPNDYLEVVPSDRCTASPKDIKTLSVGYFVLTNGDKKNKLVIGYQDNQIVELIGYFYSSKSGKITCNFEEKDYKTTTNATVKAGWNKIYSRRIFSADGYEEIDESSTKNILTKEVKWILGE